MLHASTLPGTTVKVFGGWWVGGGGVESKFSVSFGPIWQEFKLWNWTWTKLNNMINITQN